MAGYELPFSQRYMQRTHELTPDVIWDREFQDIVAPLIRDQYSNPQIVQYMLNNIPNNPGLIYEIFNTADAFYARLRTEARRLYENPVIYFNPSKFWQAGHRVGAQLFKNWDEAVMRGREMRIAQEQPQIMYV